MKGIHKEVFSDAGKYRLRVRLYGLQTLKARFGGEDPETGMSKANLTIKDGDKTYDIEIFVSVKDDAEVNVKVDDGKNILYGKFYEPYLHSSSFPNVEVESYHVSKPETRFKFYTDTVTFFLWTKYSGQKTVIDSLLVYINEKK